MKTLTASSVLLSLPLLFSSASMAAGKPEITDELVSLGEAAYAVECASCHGVEGDGEGPGAIYLNPKPRNFQLGVYKLRSTPNGELPTQHDLFNTITNGISNSMMPAFHSLSEDERWGLVEVIRRFGGIEDEEGEAITVSARTEFSDASVQNGMAVYERLDCASCHGPTGWGNGDSSLTLENDAKERVWPANLQSGVYKGGSEPHQLYQRIANGLDGSPMPSYSEEASAEEIWDLVNYLTTLPETSPVK